MPPPPQGQQYGGYGAMPPAPDAGSAPQPPTEVRLSFWGFALSAVIVVVAALLLLGQRDQMTSAATDSVRQNGQRITDAQLHTIVNATLIAAIVIAVIIAGLYVLFAYKARAGRNWARVVLTIIAVLALIELAVGSSSILGIIGRVLAVASAVALYLPNSNGYFTAAKRRR